MSFSTSKLVTIFTDVCSYLGVRWDREPTDALFKGVVDDQGNQVVSNLGENIIYE